MIQVGVIMIAAMPVLATAELLSIWMSAAQVFPSTAATIDVLRSRRWATFALQCLGGLVTLGFFAALMLTGPGIWTVVVMYFGCRLAFAGAEVVIGRQAPIPALRGSWRLTGREHVHLPLIGLCFLVGVLHAGISWLVNALATGGEQMVEVLLAPIGSAIMTRAYLQVASPWPAGPVDAP
jgi:hypothetical protein